MAVAGVSSFAYAVCLAYSKYFTLIQTLQVQDDGHPGTHLTCHYLDLDLNFGNPSKELGYYMLPHLRSASSCIEYHIKACKHLP